MYGFEDSLSEEKIDYIMTAFRKMRVRNLENIMNIFDDEDDGIRNEETREEIKDKAAKWFKTFEPAEGLKESFDFRNRFMKLAGILRG